MSTFVTRNLKFSKIDKCALVIYRAGVKTFQLPRECLDGVSLSSAGRLSQMTAADTANALVPIYD